MAEVFDYKTPVTVTITNTNTADAVEMFDGGSFTGPMAPKPGEPAYKDMSIEVPVYHSNIVKKLAPGDALTLACGSSREMAHYSSLAEIEGVTVEADTTGA